MTHEEIQEIQALFDEVGVQALRGVHAEDEITLRQCLTNIIQLTDEIQSKLP